MSSASAATSIASSPSSVDAATIAARAASHFSSGTPNGCIAAAVFTIAAATFSALSIFATVVRFLAAVSAVRFLRFFAGLAAGAARGAGRCFFFAMGLILTFRPEVGNA